LAGHVAEGEGDSDCLAGHEGEGDSDCLWSLCHHPWSLPPARIGEA
jgi:hypothetical protein